MKPPSFQMPTVKPSLPTGHPVLPGREKVKPSLKTRHIKLGARSAFPAAPTAFPTPDNAAGPGAAFSDQPSETAAPGDQGE